MTQQEAKEWAVKKWQYIVDNDGSSYGLLRAHPELRDFSNNCSYCQMYIENSMSTICTGCPLLLNDLRCTYVGHPYLDWVKDSTKENAQKVLDLILST